MNMNMTTTTTQSTNPVATATARKEYYRSLVAKEFLKKGIKYDDFAHLIHVGEQQRATSTEKGELIPPTSYDLTTQETAEGYRLLALALSLITIKSPGLSKEEAELNSNSRFVLEYLPRINGAVNPCDTIDSTVTGVSEEVKKLIAAVAIKTGIPEEYILKVSTFEKGWTKLWFRDDLPSEYQLILMGYKKATGTPVKIPLQEYESNDKSEKDLQGHWVWGVGTNTWE
jgi:hypothetical protein